MPTRRLPVREAELFKALGHPIRLQILSVLAQEEACVCHLEARLKMRQAYLSQQLAVLREAGLVAERRMGTYVYYRARRPQVVELIEGRAHVHRFRHLGVPRPNPLRLLLPALRRAGPAAGGDDPSSHPTVGREPLRRSKVFMMGRPGGKNPALHRG